jgi:uncharacterized protein YndB with AHSA1/START domain
MSEPGRADDREIVSARLMDAPRERVFRACSDPRHLARWWGPAGFTNTFQECDPRPGGAWRFVMHGPDGTDYRNESRFVEVAPPLRLVIEHIRPMHRFLLTMTFADEGGKTRLTWRMRFDSAAEVERVRPFVPAANEQNLDRLTVELATMALGGES